MPDEGYSGLMPDEGYSNWEETMYEGGGQAFSEDIDACPNCGYLVVSLSIREQPVLSGDVLWVEALKCLFCDAAWEEWD